MSLLQLCCQPHPDVNSEALCSSSGPSPVESSRAYELLSELLQLQPLLFGLTEELLSVSLELNAGRLQEVTDSIRQQVRMEKETQSFIPVAFHAHIYILLQ